MEAWLRSDNRPTAVIGSDFRLYALGLAAQRVGLRIPDDLELLGMGNTPYSQACGFDSISFDEPEMARQIAELVLADDASLGNASRNIAVTPRLVTR